MVNGLVKAHYAGQKTKLDRYYDAGKDRPACTEYREPVTFAFECLVRPLDRRIYRKLEDDPRWTELCESQVASDTREGLLLTAPFCALLEDYERSGKPFDRYLPELLKKLAEHSATPAGGGGG